MEEWVLPDGLSKHRVAIDRLVQLRVFVEAVDRYMVILSLKFSVFMCSMKMKSRHLCFWMLRTESFGLNDTWVIASLKYWIMDSFLHLVTCLRAFAIKPYFVCNRLYFNGKHLFPPPPLICAESLAHIACDIYIFFPFLFVSFWTLIWVKLSITS